MTESGHISSVTSAHFSVLEQSHFHLHKACLKESCERGKSKHSEVTDVRCVRAKSTNDSSPDINVTKTQACLFPSNVM